jgi:ATP-dependent RNA helicase MSS116
LLPLFRDQEGISPALRQALAEVLFDSEARMTQVQAETLVPGLRGDDVLARAKTGTGKTIAFLVPALERLKTGTDEEIQTRSTRTHSGAHTEAITHAGSAVQVLCISPTRELATQISGQAESLLTFHPAKPHVQTLFGGQVKPRVDIKRFKQNPPAVVVATPGRLLAHLRDGTLGRNPLRHLSVLVLDEAGHNLHPLCRYENRLLCGHLTRVAKILSALPPSAKCLASPYRFGICRLGHRRTGRPAPRPWIQQGDYGAGNPFC